MRSTPGPMPRSSIAAKLMRMNVLVAAIALILACASFLAYDAYSFREGLIQSLTTEAQIVGANSVSALTFDDADAARTTLSALRNSPLIVYARINTASGQPFAEYRRDSNTSEIGPVPLTLRHQTQHWTRGDQLLVGSRIYLAGKQIGTVYLQAETTEIGRRVRRYLGIASSVLVLCLFAALILTSSVRRLIAEPIAGLALVAQSVSRNQDFSIRAEPSAETDEVGVLVRSFNEMLVQIQLRDRALVESRDVLEQRVQERTAELQSANRELEAFSYSVAHDLRGPLDSIGNTVFLLNQAGDAPLSDPQNHELIELLSRTAARMARLIDDLLDLSRSKSVALHLEPVNLSRMAQEILEDLKVAEPARSVAIDIAPGLVAIADQGLTRVLLTNLLGNAWKYSARTERACIQFGALQDGEESVFFVRDNGAGFDPRLKSRLFHPFQRLHAQSDFHGTGIGLATVQRIIARHNGRIWAEGDIGKGATFYFTLP